MHPILFEIRGFPVYTYGVLLAAAYLLGLQFALMRAKARGLDPNRVMDLGIWIIVSALVGAKLLLLVVEWDTYTPQPGGAADAGAIGRRVLRRADPRGRWWRSGTCGGTGMPLWTVSDVVRARASRSATSSAGWAASSPGCCFGKPTSVPVGDHVPQRVRRAERRHADQRPAASDAAVRSRRRAADPRRCCSPPSARAGRSRAGRSGATCCSTGSRASSSSSTAATSAARSACSRPRSSCRC